MQVSSFIYTRAHLKTLWRFCPDMINALHLGWLSCSSATYISISVNYASHGQRSQKVWDLFMEWLGMRRLFMVYVWRVGGRASSE